MRPARLDLRIDELVLDGFAPGDEAGVRDGVQRELARLLPLPPGGEAAAAAIGDQVARAIQQEAGG
jgi:hypothetical protein